MTAPKDLGVIPRQPLPVGQRAQFAVVAHILSNGKPQPEGLVLALADFRRLIGRRKSTAADDDEDKQMLEAAKYLEKWLPIYTVSDEEWDLQIPDCAEGVQILLPELIEFLESQIRPPRLGGKTPDGRRLLCAGVCAEAYSILHGKLHLHSGILRQACEDYWLACGNPATSTPSGAVKGANVRDNWRAPLEQYAKAKSAGDDWIAARLALYLTPRK
jgi:hypothetical protein